MTKSENGNSEIKFRDSWKVDNADNPPKFQEEDSGIFINNQMELLYLPADYKAFMAMYPGGITPMANDNFILAQFKNESFEVQLEYLYSLEDVISDYSSGYNSTFVDGSKSKLPAQHAIIASGLMDDFILNVDPESNKYGHVYNWTRSGDPWGTGDNTEGLGWVADSFSDLMNQLSEESDTE